MASADQRTIAAGTPVATLMERAGVAVAWDVRAALGGCYGKRVVVVCGKGNNGGDGLVVGACARAVGRAHARVRARDVVSTRVSLARALASAHVVIDAMFGTGLQRALDGDAAMVVDQLRDWDGLTVAVDIPSGIDGLTGAVRGAAVHADRTVTFAARKPGLLLEPGRSHAGVVRVADIGIDLGPDGAEPVPLGCFDDFDVAACLPPRAPSAHKWSNAVMVVGGSRRHDRRADVHESRGDARGRGHGVVRDTRGRGRTARGRDRGRHRALPDEDGFLARNAARSRSRRSTDSARLRSGRASVPTTGCRHARARPPDARRGAGRARRRRAQRARRRPRAARGPPRRRPGHRPHAPRRRVRADRGRAGRRRPHRGGAGARGPQRCGRAA